MKIERTSDPSVASILEIFTAIPSFSMRMIERPRCRINEIGIIFILLQNKLNARQKLLFSRYLLHDIF